MKQSTPEVESKKIIRSRLCPLAWTYKPGSCTAPDCKSQCVSGAFLFAHSAIQSTSAGGLETGDKVVDRQHRKTTYGTTNEPVGFDSLNCGLACVGMGKHFKSKAAQKCAAFSVLCIEKGAPA